MKHDEKWQEENLPSFIGCDAHAMVRASDFAEAYAEHSQFRLNELVNEKEEEIVASANQIAVLENKLKALSRCVLDIDTTVCIVSSNPQLRDAKTMAALNLKDEKQGCEMCPGCEGRGSLCGMTCDVCGGAGHITELPANDSGETYCASCDSSTLSIECGSCNANIKCENCEAFSRENDWVCQSCMDNGEFTKE